MRLPMFRRKATSIHPEFNRGTTAPSRRPIALRVLKLTAIGAGSLLIIAGTWALVEMSASTPDPAKVRMAELKGRSVAHAFVIEAYEKCMAPEGSNRYRCIKSTADAAKAKSMTAFQIVGVFKDYGVNVNSMDFPQL